MRFDTFLVIAHSGASDNPVIGVVCSRCDLPHHIVVALAEAE
jgi:hypothetical protein